MFALLNVNAGGGDGFEVIYALRDTEDLAKAMTEEIASTGQNVRGYYQKRLPSDPSLDYYYILRDTANTQANLVEYGFLDSPDDDVSQLKNNWQQYAEAIVKAVTEYIGVPYSIPDVVIDYYVVKSGDTLWSIAKLYGISVDELKYINSLTSNTLSIGQQLRVPNRESTDTSIVYTVKAGDTLYGIANKFNVTVSELKIANNLTNDILSIGQQINIPTESQDEQINYKVVAGDSLWSISRKYGVSVDELKNKNNLASDVLSIGQILIIPTKGSVEPETYIVKAGDSLWSISRKFNTSVDAIKKLNNLTSELLSINQVLLIP